MSTVNIIGNFQAAGNAPGVVPLGAIIAMTSGLTGAMAIPASGVVSNGYMRADGTAIPANNAVSGTSPNLSGSIYLRGSTTYGGTGGANTKNISASNVPALTITGSNSASFVSGSIDNTNLSHTHTYSGNTNTTDINHQHSGSGLTVGVYASGSNNGMWHSNASAAVAAGDGGGPTNNKGIDGSTSFGQNWVNGPSHLHGYSGTTDGASVGMSHSHSFSLTAAAQSWSGSYVNGSQAAFDVQPNYINVVYLIRVN
jgi:hypothetical protein